MCAAARPSFSAVSAVTGSTFATPRTPSVPKIFFACATVVTLSIKERRFTNHRFSGGRFGKRLALFHLINLAVQCPSADAELLRGLRDVAVRCRERLHDEASLGFVKIKRARFFAERLSRRDPGRQRRARRAPDIRRQIAQ